MPAIEPRPPLQPGERAPDFSLPRVDREGTASLADYRGKSPLLLALFRGFWCGTCRRAVARLGLTQDKLRAVGVETLGVVATGPENARLYLRFHPLRAPLASDPELATHRAYGVPKPELTPELIETLRSTRINPTGELPEPVPILDLTQVLAERDGFKPTETDTSDMQRQMGQHVGKFLIDRGGIVRWVYIEGLKEGPSGFCKFPTDEEILAAARGLPA